MQIADDFKTLRLMRWPFAIIPKPIIYASRILYPVMHFAKPIEGIKKETISLEGMKCTLLMPHRAKGTILDIHGGGFVFPAAPYKLKIASLYAKEGFRVILPDYPLLPKHAHPEALNTLINLVLSISDLAAISGDSAGGFLALRTATALKDTPPMMLIYPVVSPEETESKRKYTNTPMWNSKLDKWMWKNYLGGTQLEVLDYKRISKAFIEIAQHDPLHDEGLELWRILEENNADVTLSDTEGTVHGYDFLWKKPLTMKYIERRLNWLRSL